MIVSEENHTLQLFFHKIFSTMTKRTSLIFLISLLLLPSFASIHAEKPAITEPRIPAPSGTLVETYCGKQIADPYRPLENLQDPVVRKWIKQESDLAKSVLQSIPGRKELIGKMLDFDNRKTSKVYELSITDNDRYFYLKRTPKDETGKLYTREGYKGSETLLFDSRTFSGDRNIQYVISKISPNDDGSKVAFTVAPNGSENEVLLIMNVAAKTLYPEKIDRCWFAEPSWLPDGSGFLYNRLQSGTMHDINREKDSKVFFHKVGTDPSGDREIFSRATGPELNIRPEDIPAVIYDKESKTLFAFASNVDNRINAWYAPTGQLFEKKISWTRLFKPSDEIHDFAVTDTDIYCLSSKNAPRFKLLKTPLQHPDPQHAEVVVPENPEAILTGFGLSSEGIYFSTSINGVKADVYRKGFDGRPAMKLELPFAAGTVGLSTKGFKYPEAWAIMGGWSNDYRRFRYELKTGKFLNETLSSPARYPEYENLTVEELMVPSHDGVQVPLSLIYRKNTKKNGKNPVLLYGYGAYGNSMTPFFSPSLLLWTHNGGILAVPHVRGGGELGDSWHRAGMKTTKQNTWKDLIACTEYIISEGFTTPEHIAINGASAGGILIGMAMTERPDLFAAAMPQVGVLNPLRGEESPNGPVNVPEFGTVKDPVECRALIDMDPYLHLKKGIRYPAALITAGMNDPRVIAWQPAKFAARLQAVSSSEKPVLFFTDYEAGHGVGDTKTKQFESLADILSFGLWQTGHPDFQAD